MLRRILHQRRLQEEDREEDHSDDDDDFEWTTLRHNGPWFESTNPNLSRDEIVNLYRRVPDMYRDKTFWDNFEEEVSVYNISRREISNRPSSNIPDPRTCNTSHETCFIDGKEEKITNWRMEPPVVFIGRGDHPLRGRLRRRVVPGDVTLNLDVNAKVPKMKWGGVVHRPECGWLWSWKDPLLGKVKYVYPSAHSHMHAKREKKKFDEVYILKDHIWNIRSFYETSLKRGEHLEVACILYLIDHLGLRIGSSEVSGVDGASTLKVGCVQILDGRRVVRIRFRGKDSVEYDNQIMCDDYFVNAIRKLSRGKGAHEFLFPNTTSQDVNNLLATYHPSIKSKTFRTFNATMRFKEMIHSEKPADEKCAINLFKKCVTEVAVFCNHKRISSIKKVKSEQYSPTTSITNYIDPRVVIGWARDVGVPLSKIYSKSLLERFSWAI